MAEMTLEAIAELEGIKPLMLVKWAQGRMRNDFPAACGRFAYNVRAYDSDDVRAWLRNSREVQIFLERERYGLKTDESYFDCLRKLVELRERDGEIVLEEAFVVVGLMTKAERAAHDQFNENVRAIQDDK